MEKEEREVLRDTLDKLDMTKEEINRFEKAFKDPKFKEMFEDYAKEISDPKARAESEAYLRQIESGNQAQNVYGADVQLIVPEENFVVKTRKEDDQSKVFINVCTSEKVAKAESKKSVKNGREGNTWSIPFSLGQERTTKDKSGKEALVFDFVLHPDTCDKCSFPPFKDMVAQTAIENIEKSKDMKLEKSVTYLKTKKYVGSEGMDRPGVQAVRTSQANNGGAGPIKPLNTPLDANTALDDKKSESSSGGTTRSPFSFQNATVRQKKAKAVTSPKEGQPGYVYASGERVPAFSIVEKGEYDILEMWGDMGKAMNSVPKRPKELVFKVELPGVKSVKDMSLEVTRAEVILSVQKMYKLEAKLPYEVYDQKGKAKFDKKRQTLEITIPVIPPPKPEPKPFTEPEPEISSVSVVPSGDVQNKQPKEKEDHRPSQSLEDKENVSSTAEDPPAPARQESETETENERRWKAMHAEKHQAQEMLQKQAKEKAVVSSNDEKVEDVDASKETQLKQIQETLSKKNNTFASCNTFCGRIEGYVFKADKEGLGYYKDLSQGLHTEETTQTTTTHNKGTSSKENKTVQQENNFIIKPSPNASLWDDID